MSKKVILSLSGGLDSTTLLLHLLNKDYDEIYMRYFLKPGALLFVDFGWNTLLPTTDDETKNSLYTIKDILYIL